MQPEPPATSFTALADTVSFDSSSTTTQHGISEKDTGDGGGPLSSTAPSARTGAGPAEASTSQLALDAAFAASLQEEHEGGASHERRRLSPRTDTPSPPPAWSRITEYEQASTPPVRNKREGPAFEVIKKQRAPGDKRSPVADLPNEILTHALAHLAPNDLASVSLVSKRFHQLVTTPYAWRSAFARYFPGPESINALERDSDDEEELVVRTERRAFTRLTPLASWRSEYIMRTRLLRSLGRGKPVQTIASPSASRAGQSHTATPITMYNSQLFTTVNHLHANFGTGLNKRPPRFIHGADEFGQATSSDPGAGKIDNWGLSDRQFFLQFSERFPGDAQYGLGPGELVGVPNVMAVSQPHGMIHGEGSPGGMLYFRSVEEMRGRFLSISSELSAPQLGIPHITAVNEAICAVWIAKSPSIPSLTEGSIGMMSGSSLGVVTAYSLGSNNPIINARDERFGRGEMTARWVLCPGVPIIAITVDNEYSLARQAQNRIWAVVLNALGEVFYLTKFPKRPHVDRGTRIDEDAIERTAWLAGRTVYWNLVEPSRRNARPDPYAEARIDGSYSPRSSWNGMCLSEGQISAEAREMEAFLSKKPKDFQRACEGWDMRRRMEMDFAGDDGHNAGEGIIVWECGVEEGSLASVKRYTRHRVQEKPVRPLHPTTPSEEIGPISKGMPSLFGAPAPTADTPSTAFPSDNAMVSSQIDLSREETPRPATEEWRISNLTFGDLKNVQILATAVDQSTHALETTSEDPLLNFSTRSSASSATHTPMTPVDSVSSPADVPGQRARLVAAGTHTGTIFVWNMRAPTSASAGVINDIGPVRIIYTDSPQISCLALSSLYLVHGGNDGLVQAWDLLASDTQPVRTLNSRFSSRARRRLVQAQASPQGVGINLFAAGAICLDPDATVLRGMASLGTHLRYWSYSSSAADAYKSQKRRLRRSERGSNNGGERFSGATRTNLKDYIASEKFEMERAKEHNRKEAERMAGRFGTEMLDGSEEELMAYAAMLSQEQLERDNMRRVSDTTSAQNVGAVSTEGSVSNWSTDTATPAGSLSPHEATPKTDDEFDADVAEAIRLSLAQESSSHATFDIPIRKAKAKGKKSGSARASPRTSPPLAGASKGPEMDDLDFAIQLSLAEERSRAEAETFPALDSTSGNAVAAKGKGKGRAL